MQAAPPRIQKIRSNTPWEDIVGYSRAVRVGNWISVSGTTATTADGSISNIGDVYGQTQQTIRNIQSALERAGSGLADVVRTRIFVRNIDLWQEIARAHSEFFDSVRPATSMIEVSRFIATEILVEIEADALVRVKGSETE